MGRANLSKCTLFSMEHWVVVAQAIFGITVLCDFANDTSKSQMTVRSLGALLCWYRDARWSAIDYRRRYTTSRTVKAFAAEHNFQESFV